MKRGKIIKTDNNNIPPDRPHVGEKTEDDVDDDDYDGDAYRRRRYKRNVKVGGMETQLALCVCIIFM